MADGEPSDTEPGAEQPAKRFIQQNRVGLAIVGGILLLALVVVVASSGGDSSDEAVSVSETTADDGPPASTAPPTTAAGTGLIDMDSVPCSGLLEEEDIDEGLGVADLPFSERSYFEFSSVETCTYQLADDDAVYFTLEPGRPSDLELDGVLLGVTGEPVLDVGEAALWFSGRDPESGEEAGTLAVGQTTDIGALFFRVTIGRPGAGPTEQLQSARTVALAALPRFPGVEAAEPEPEPDVEPVDAEPFDRAGLSYTDNLLAREADGEWTRGEGLVQTLGLFVGEVDADDVLRDPDIANPAGSGVIALARQYLQDGSDENAQEEIARLLGELFPSQEEIEAMAAEAQGASASGELEVVLVDAPSRRSQQQETTLCEAWWDALDPCEEIVTSPLLDQKYRIIFPRATVKETYGWTAVHRSRALQAMEAAIPRYEGLGRMPAIDVVFTPFGGPLIPTDYEDPNYCQVAINTPMQADSPAHFQQRIAAGLAYCYLGATYPAQVSRYETVFWWWEGMDIWLSTLPYPESDLELVNLPGKLEAMELENTLPDRAYANWIFFEHRARELSDQANVRLASSMPTSGGSGAQADALEGSESAADVVSGFVKGLTDANMPDSGGGTVTYDPPVTQKVEISCEPASHSFDVSRFGTTRVELVVEDGLLAQFEYDETDGLLTSWREGESGEASGSWSEELPVALQGEAVFVSTSIERDGELVIDVTDVTDMEGDDCDEPPPPPPPPDDCDIGCIGTEFYYQISEGIEQFFQAFADAIGN